MNAPGSLLGLAAGLALAACTGTRIDPARDPGGYSMSKAWAVTGGLQRIEIVGAPPDGASPEEIAAVLRGPSIYPPTRYEAAPPGGSGLRIVLEFGQRGATSAACRAPSGQDGVQPLTVTATFCSGQNILRAVTMRDATLEGPSSPGFADAMALLFRHLLPEERRRTTFFRNNDND